MNPRNRKKLDGAKPKPPTVERTYLTYWLTRDAGPDGVPSRNVDVWWSRPVRYPVGERGGFWLDRYNGLTEKQATWTVEAAAALGAYPDDSVQCIRVGQENATRDALAIVTKTADA